MENFKISLVIPAYNEEKYLETCLKSAIENPNSKFFEIIVIDNASTDNTSLIIKQFPNVKLFKEVKKGTSFARQRGLKEATGDIIAFIDADTIIPNGWLEKAKQKFSKDDKIICLSGPYKYYDGHTVKNSIVNFFWWLTAPIAYRFTGYMILGGNFIVKKNALETIGGFDHDVKFYGDDTNLARRLNKVGKVVFDMNFYIYTSNRRFEHEGVFTTCWRYGVNFLWQVIFHKSYTEHYQDIRLKK